MKPAQASNLPQALAKGSHMVVKGVEMRRLVQESQQ